LVAESKTQHGATQKLERPAGKRKAIKLLAQGLSNAAVAQEMGVHRSSVVRFTQRYRGEIGEAIERYTRTLEDYAIADKLERIADLDSLRTMAQSELRKNGYAWDEETRYGTKRHVSGAVTELRMTLRQAAEELDQLPRAGVTVHNQNVVIVKHVEGAAELD
jgi:transposase